MRCLQRALGLVAVVIVAFPHFGFSTRGSRGKSKSRQCGTLDSKSALTKHCFPADASSHSVCCVDIRLPGHRRFYTELEDMIAMASSSKSYSWCTCTEDICEKLSGRVAWVLNPGGTKTASSLDKQGETLQEEEKRVNAQSNNPFAMLEDLVEESPPSASDWMPKQQKRQGIRNLVADSLSRGTKSQQCSARERHARMDMDSTAPDTEDTMRRKAQTKLRRIKKKSQRGRPKRNKPGQGRTKKKR